MQDIIGTIFAAIVGLMQVAAIVALMVHVWNKGREARETGENVPVIVENESDEGEVLEIVKRAYFGLKKQRAAGFGPWLSCLIAKQDGDRALALTALWRTRDELTGSRFDLSGLDRAIVALETEAGE